MDTKRGYLTHQGPRWFSIEAGRSFLDHVVDGLFLSLGAEPSQALILMPTRRGTRALARTFGDRMEAMGIGATLLPQIRAIGDLDESEPPFDLEHLGLDLPPAISPLKRRFELATLIQAHYRPRDSTIPAPRTCLELADALGAFFQSCALEDIDITDRLARLSESEGDDEHRLAEFAEHWQHSVEFLNIAGHLWPLRLQALGLMDPSERQVRLIRRLAEQWRDHPPQGPVILAGSTGTAPAMADLMAVVASLPQGAVILPGLDFGLSDAAWQEIEDQHPQGALKRLLTRHGLDRGQVQAWPAGSSLVDRAGRARRRLINEALRPAEATKDWLAQIAVLQSETDNVLDRAMDGLSLIMASHDEDAAQQIALIMVERLQNTTKTIALVTPDAVLARRVSARLTRFRLQADSSSGVSLGLSRVGHFISDVARLFADPSDPVAWLSLIKHPYFQFSDRQADIDALETYALRGARPRSVLDIDRRLSAVPSTQTLWRELMAVVESFRAVNGADMSRIAVALTGLSEAMASDKGQILWCGADGAAMAGLMSDLIREGESFTPSDLEDGLEIIAHMINQTSLRTGGNTHPRLMILGAIEGRLIKADCVILAGLEDGIWPQNPPIDPFLSRPLRRLLSLPQAERRIGLSAHDFVQSACGPDVFLVQRQSTGGAPAVASRWLWRLKTLCKGAGLTLENDKSWQDLARRLDRNRGNMDGLLPAQRPAPRPPARTRPRRLSVTQIETLIRDPYALYARMILGLKRLDRPNEPFEALHRGNALHRAAERFVIGDYDLGAEAKMRFEALLMDALAEEDLDAVSMAMQTPCLSDIAHHFIEFERSRRTDHPHIIVEKKAEFRFDIDAKPFTLVAKADRIEVRPDRVDILDYKSGEAPSNSQVLEGFNPQLTLTAAMAHFGAFEPDVPKGLCVGDLWYVPLSAKDKKSTRIKDKTMTQTEIALAAFDRLMDKIRAFDHESTPYVSWRAPQKTKRRPGDYDPLARLAEWQEVSEDDTDSEGDEA